MADLILCKMNTTHSNTSFSNAYISITFNLQQPCNQLTYVPFLDYFLILVSLVDVNKGRKVWSPRVHNYFSNYFSSQEQNLIWRNQSLQVVRRILPIWWISHYFFQDGIPPLDPCYIVFISLLLSRKPD